MPFIKLHQVKLAGLLHEIDNNEFQVPAGEQEESGVQKSQKSQIGSQGKTECRVQSFGIG